ncbi:MULTISPECIES: helix-turn-helix domain-containing protein [unclassified Bradyrhizobium]|uniref:helix-turn-helix domain-containing protein n=1 Tax=unclassified Bradyrhizobium TaxID=2631580 RepID=UPI0028EF1412|nr:MULTISPECIES: hypothetical protein [unclassified Bradyrhizobium]
MRAIRLSAEKTTEVQQAWHGTMTRARVAQEYGLSEKAVRTIWKRARKAGLLPMASRPHFEPAPSSPVHLGTDPAADLTDAEIVFEAAEMHEANVRCSGGLLAALRRHHSGDPAAHDRPSDYALRCELKGEAVPTPADIMVLCRIHDLNSSN